MALSADAAFVSLNVTNRSDYAFAAQGVLYITAGSQVVRYDTRTSSYLTPFEVGGNLAGIDLSPDGTTLAVADYSTQGANNRVHLLNRVTGADNVLSFTRQSLESGTFMVAWGADGRLLTTSSFNGSGWVPLRRYDPATGQTESIGTVRQSTMLTPSADRKTIGLAESNISSGPISAYSTASGNLTGTVNTDWFTFEVAVSRDGTRFLVPTYDGAFVYDRSGSTFTLKNTLGVYADHGPLAGVFAPNGDVLFTAEYDWNNKVSGVKAYDAKTLAQLAVIDPYRFGWGGNGSMGPGRMEISPDGHWLVVSTTNGARLYDVSALSPEPGGLALVGAAGAVMLGRRRRVGH
jgi:WD40 repeat protein